MSETMLAKWNKWAAGVQINDRQMTPDNNEYTVAMAAFYAGYDSHAIESEAAQLVPQPNRGAIKAVIAKELADYNAVTHGSGWDAEALQHKTGLAFEDLDEDTAECIADRVIAALSPAPLSIDREALTDDALWDFAHDLLDAWNIEDVNPPSLVEQFRDQFVARFLSAHPVAGEVTRTVWHKDQFWVNIETDAEGHVTISDELLVKLMTESGWIEVQP